MVAITNGQLDLGLSAQSSTANSTATAASERTIVTIVCDSLHKYQSTPFNRQWLESNHLDPDLPLDSTFG